MKLVKLNTDHYIIVDDSEIKIGDWYYDFHNQEVCQSTFNKLPIEFGNCKKITHSTQPIEQYYGATDGTIPFVYHKIIELPLSEVKELIGEVDVEKKATDYSKTNSKIESTGAEEFGRYWGFKEGYNQALEDNKEKKYTEQDIRNVIRIYSHAQNELTIGDIIKSLQPETEWEVEIVEGKITLKKHTQ